MEDEKKTESTTKNVKKANLLDHNSVKNILDESVSDVSLRKTIHNKNFPRFLQVSLILDSFFSFWLLRSLRAEATRRT